MAPKKATTQQAVKYGDQQIERGHGGETHQIATDGQPRLTTQQGTVVSDDQNTLRADERGPSVLEDFHARSASRNGPAPQGARDERADDGPVQVRLPVPGEPGQPT